MPEAIAVTTIWFGLSVTEFRMLGSATYTRRRRDRVFRNSECPTTTWSNSAPDVTRLRLPDAPAMDATPALETAPASAGVAACAEQDAHIAAFSRAAPAATPARAIKDAGFALSSLMRGLIGNRPSSRFCPGWSQPYKFSLPVVPALWALPLPSPLQQAVSFPTVRPVALAVP